LGPIRHDPQSLGEDQRIEHGSIPINLLVFELATSALLGADATARHIIGGYVFGGRHHFTADDKSNRFSNLRLFPIRANSLTLT
jgi:hypothetical protein